MSDVILQEKKSFLDYAERRGLALFPCQEGAKNPIIKWLEGSTFDRAQAAAWQSANHNLAIDCAKSGIVVIDVDASKVTPADAWKAYTDLCEAWGLSELPAFMTHSARNGWHVPFRRPAEHAATDLRGGGTLVKISDVRPLAEGEEDGEVIGFKNRGYCIAPGSSLVTNSANLYYRLAANLPDEFPEAPPALIEAIKKPPVDPSRVVAASGSLSFDDAKQFYQWMAEENFIDGDDAWREAGMAAKLAFGEAGIELWETLATRGGLDANSLNRWKSFASEQTPGCVTLNSVMKRAHDAGWKGTIRQSAESMFAGVAQYAQSPPLAPASYPVPTPQEVEAPKPLRVISAASFAGREAPPREELVTGLIPAKIVGALYADGGTGKSLVAGVQLGTAVASGKLWLDRIVQQGPVVYLCAEDDEAEVHRRLVDACRGMSVDIATLDNFHILPLADEEAVLAIADARSSVLQETVLYQQVAALTERIKPTLLILDTLSDIFAGAENDRMQAKQFVKMMRKLIVPHGGTGLILAHPSLDGMRSGSGSAGSTGWNNALRWRGYLERVLEPDGRELDQTRRVLKTKKANYGATGSEIEIRWQNGCFHVAGAGSEAVAMMDPLWKEKRADRVFLDRLRWHIENKDFVSMSKRGGLYAPEIFRKEARLQGVEKSELEEAMARLLDRKEIENVPFGSKSRGYFRLFIPGMAAII